jgi:hypothetical protein
MNLSEIGLNVNVQAADDEYVRFYASPGYVDSPLIGLNEWEEGGYGTEIGRTIVTCIIM